MDPIAKDTNNSQWVDERMAVLSGFPDWEPDTLRGLDRLRARAGSARFPRRIFFWSAGFLAVLAAFLVVPLSRALAQRLWERRSVTELEVLRLAPVGRLDVAQAALPLTYAIAPQEAQRVADLAAAARLAGFAPQRPLKLSGRSIAALFLRDPFSAPFQVWTWGNQELSSPRVTVSGPVVAQIQVRVASLNAALQSLGISDVSISPKWEGAMIGIEFSPTVVAQYDVVQLAQTLPYSLVWPNDFPVAGLIESVLRILGMTAEDAQRARNSFAENPVSFALIPPETQLAIREVPLGMGPLRNPWKALLFENTGTSESRCAFCPAPSERMLIWSTPDRIFALKGKLTEDDLIAIAHSIM